MEATAVSGNGHARVRNDYERDPFASMDVMLSEPLFLHHSTSEIFILFHMLTTQCGGYNSDGRLVLKAAFLPPCLFLPRRAE